MATKDYEGAGIVVHWDADRCIHSAKCVQGLPTVFNTAARPWIDTGGAGADRIAAAVDTCPSRALTYTRTDGGPVGPGALADGEGGAAEIGAVTVTVRPGGPLAVDGVVEVVGPDGAVLRRADRVFLCRCGASATKPFCDGSHAAVDLGD